MNSSTSITDNRFSALAMALNALERSRANEKMIDRYKCPCTLCKGGGRAIQRLSIEKHLRQHGRDPALTHSMLVRFPRPKVNSESSFKCTIYAGTVVT